MTKANWKLKEGASLHVEEVAKIACALKSLSVCTAMVCDEENSSEGLKKTVEEGLQAMDRIFDY